MKVLYEHYIRRQRSGSNHNTINNNNHAVNISDICHSTDLVMDSDHLSSRPPIAHIISHDSLLINKELGVGEFGLVQQGKYSKRIVFCLIPNNTVYCVIQRRLDKW